MEPALQATLSAIASFFLLTFVFAAFFFLCRSSNKPLPRSRPTPTGGLSSISVGESASFDPSLNRISMAELAASTGNFADAGVVGDGGFGLVYKARLSSGATVAVKKLSPDAFQGFREFRAEMETLGKLRHKNIVKILGYCISGSERLLIYEFIERGSLDQWLYGYSAAGHPGPVDQLGWERRKRVISGVAEGLSYLHNLDKPVIHRDIKAGNVLLDAAFEAHIADFGLARRIDASGYSHVSTQVAGTTGYMPPEYREGAGVATAKADVYSFGMLVLEIATGRRPNLPVRWEGKEVGLAEWAREMAARGREREMVDSGLAADGRLREDEVREVFRIARLCTSETPGERPAMKEAVELLKLCFEFDRRS